MRQSLCRIAVYVLLWWIAKAGDSSPKDGKERQPAPIQVEPDGGWWGIDGPWTAFVVNVGVPYTKTLRLVPSMSLPEFYLIHPAGCARAGNITFNGLPCDRSRGGIFYHNSSNSHVHNAMYDFSSNAVFHDFGYSLVKGDVGWDTFSLGFLKEDAAHHGMDNLEHLLVAEIASNNFTWLGMLGIDVRRTNFSDTGEIAPQETLMSKLKRSKYIPSLSWAYTAGCYGYGSGSQGSLILGGYDEARMIRNDVVFPFHLDPELLHTVWVEQIQVGGTVSTNGPRMSVFDISQTNFTTHIDSTRPYIYLPPPIYDEIVKLFDLKYDNRSDLLIVPNDKLETWKANKPSVSFTIRPLNRDTEKVQSVKITLPYESILLTSNYPNTKEINQTWRYVPIRRAASERQHVLGRAFLQNAYLVSDYERKSFSIHEAKLWNGAGPSPTVRPILVSKSEFNSLDSWKTEVNSLDSWKNEKPFPPLATAGIIVLSLCLLVSLLITYVLYRRRKRRHGAVKAITTEELPTEGLPTEELPTESVRFEIPAYNNSRAFEADSNQVHESFSNAIQPAVELSDLNQIHELPSTSTFPNDSGLRRINLEESTTKGLGRKAQ